MSACSSSDGELGPPVDGSAPVMASERVRAAPCSDSVASCQSDIRPHFFRRVQEFFSLDTSWCEQASRDIAESGATGLSALHAMWDTVSAVGSRQLDVIQRSIEQTSWYQSYLEKPAYHNLPFVVVLLIMGTTYVCFSLVYLPAIGVGLLGSKSVIFNTCFVMSSISYYKGICTDPGQIPDSWREVPTDPVTGRRYLLIERKKKEPDALRYCSKEQKYKPDRAHYSRDLSRNVLRMDHHCPWLGNTVGHFNHKFFYLFVFYSASAINLSTFTLTPAVVVHTFNAGQTVMMLQGVFLGGIITSCLTPFFIFHSWLLYKNMTTIEYCEKRGSNELYESPYDVGLIGNLRSVFGDPWYLWPVPMGSPPGDGIKWNMRSGIADLIPDDADYEADQNQRGQTNTPAASTAASDSDLPAAEENDGSFKNSIKSHVKKAEAWRVHTVQAFNRCISERDGKGAPVEGGSNESEDSLSRLRCFFQWDEIPLGPVPGALSAFKEISEDCGAEAKRIFDKCQATVKARLCPEPEIPVRIQTFRNSEAFQREQQAGANLYSSSSASSSSS